MFPPPGEEPLTLREWAYILSPSFSGSTLLTFLLGAHPDVSTIGELKASAMGDVEFYDCSCGVRISKCAFWNKVRSEMNRLGEPLDLANFDTHFRLPGRWLADRVVRACVGGPGFEATRWLMQRMLPGVRGELARLVERNRLLSDAITSVQGGRVFLDASKDAHRLKYLCASRIADIRVIICLRDGRGAACSFMRHTRCSMRLAAHAWRRTQEACDRMREGLSRRQWTVVRYEDLCLRTDSSLTNLFEFLGLDPDLADRDFITQEHHILGNAMRLRGTSDITLDERWRTTLSTSELTIFEATAGSLNRRLGYQ